jgi:hypothetical protein
MVRRVVMVVEEQVDNILVQMAQLQLLMVMQELNLLAVVEVVLPAKVQVLDQETVVQAVQVLLF